MVRSDNIRYWKGRRILTDREYARELLGIFEEVLEADEVGRLCELFRVED